MPRPEPKQLVTLAGSLLLAAAAAAVAIPFRALPPRTDLQSMTWDAAQHALIGLDLYDHIRRFEPLQLLLRLQAEHWWPPLFGILSLPAYLFAGREVTTPSLVSLASYCLIPAFMFFGARRVTNALPLLGAALIAVFWLRSPQMIEMSAWSMLELAATLFAVAACALFIAGPDTRARNWAYGLAGASLLLKYHYGFFLLVTFGVAVFLELPREERRRLIATVTSRLRMKSVWIPLLVVFALVIARRIEESASARPALPGVPTLIWIAYIVALIVAFVRRERTRELWSTLPERVRRFISCGLIWPMITFIDPSKPQAWYRQLRVVTDPPATFAIQLSELERYFTDDYFLGPAVLAVAAAGVIACAVEGVRRRRVDIAAVALHSIWPIALMTISKYRIESRFLATMLGVFMFSSVLGWTLSFERRPRFFRIGMSVSLVLVLFADQARRTEEWDALLAKRRVYGYMSSDPPHGFVVATANMFAKGMPVLIVLPRDIEVVWPTIRLGLRVAMPDVSPHEVIVRGGDERRFAERLRRFDEGIIGAAVDEETLRRIAGENGKRVISVEQGPRLPDGQRRLLMARVASD